MWELNYKKKAEHRRIDAFELWCWRRLESPLDCKEIQPVHPKGDQSCVFIGRPDVETETLILWPPHAEGWLIWKDPDAGKDWGQEEKGMTENEMVGWHHWHNRHGFGWTLGVGDEQGGLACCSSWRCRVGHNWATELNRAELKSKINLFIWLYPLFSDSCKLVTSTVFQYFAVGPCHELHVYISAATAVFITWKSFMETLLVNFLILIFIYSPAPSMVLEHNTRAIKMLCKIIHCQ